MGAKNLFVLSGFGASPQIGSSMAKVGLDAFAYRQFDDPEYGGSAIPYDKDKFLKKVNEIIADTSPPVVSGYAPFCKHIFIPNFTEAKLAVAEITGSNRSLLKTGYVSRCKEEIPVLSRWFSRGDLDAPKAKVLDLILYSREQIAKEAEAMGKPAPSAADPDYSIISIKAQMEGFELPMSPITMMRNSLIEEGGSGIPIDRVKYQKSVDYWEEHAELKLEK
eukprot:GHVN01066854.1.p1 GENE.GHVN01066854.1~~GHVN01066854.1.p1  ORF type:complete len:221 (+),score=35.60 GHVN01066854.1:672-1334(+)